MDTTRYDIRLCPSQYGDGWVRCDVTEIWEGIPYLTHSHEAEIGDTLHLERSTIKAVACP